MHKSLHAGFPKASKTLINKFHTDKTFIVVHISLIYQENQSISPLVHKPGAESLLPTS